MLRLQEIRALTEAQLNERVEELHEELFNLRFQRASYKTVSPARFGQIKRNIAQIKTVLREREIETLIAETERATSAKV